MNVLAVCSLLMVLRQIFAVHCRTASTTAEQPRRWAIFAIAIGIVAVACRFPVAGVPLLWQSAFQYLFAVLLLTPFVAILGARQPGAAAWPWFVVLPLAVVLQWPSISQLLTESRETMIEIPTPTAFGFVLVLVMGLGNYFGTTHTAAVGLCSLAILLVAWPVFEWGHGSRFPGLPLGCIVLAIAALMLPKRFRHAVASPAENDVAGLWADFRDAYGIVWAKRVMDRVNQFADRESWLTRLTLDGFVDLSGNMSQNSSPADREVEVLCWVLRRFLDHSFMQQYVRNDLLPTRAKYSDGV